MYKKQACKRLDMRTPRQHARPQLWLHSCAKPCDGGAVCNRYAHALALSVYAVLVAPQHFQRIPELVKRLKTLSRSHGKLPYTLASTSLLVRLHRSLPR